MQERRKAYRIRALAGRDQALLHIGGRQFEATIKDESSCGCAVLCPSPIRVQTGDLVDLQTPVGSFRARAVRVESTAGGTLLGLAHEKELPRAANRGGGPGVSRLALVAALALGALSVPVVTAVCSYWTPATREPNPTPTNTDQRLNHQAP